MHDSILVETFKKWTSGLLSREARVSVFNHIRDIPYAIVPELNTPATGPVGLLTQNRGSCNPKHFLLKMFFEKLNLPVWYVTYPFQWHEFPLKYPDEIRKLAALLPPGHHLACKALIEGRWIVVDATWDLPLQKAGFPVEGAWDGIRDTQIAVKPLGEILHETLEERLTFLSEQRKSWSEKNVSCYDKFIPKFNRWLEELRS
ncbi:MAG: hypothetical protein WC530_02105 [Candidatus Omnitrophota bacterium]|jgi:hypothetical protein